MSIELMVKRVPTVLLLLTLAACQSSSGGDQLRIRNQADADAYNAQVTNPADMLECTREKIMGSVRTRFVCMTAAQREALQAELVDIRGRGAVLGN